MQAHTVGILICVWHREAFCGALYNCGISDVKCLECLVKALSHLVLFGNFNPLAFVSFAKREGGIERDRCVCVCVRERERGEGRGP